VKFDETSALIIASLVGAIAALLATFVTLVVTRWLAVVHEDVVDR
jgi:hypothetical protein